MRLFCQKGEQTESESKNLDEDLVSFSGFAFVASVNEILHKLLALDGHFPSSELSNNPKERKRRNDAKSARSTSQTKKKATSKKKTAQQKGIK